MVRIPKIVGDTWFNLPTDKQALDSDDLKGKVVLVDFFTYSCVNCRRTIPYIIDWYEKYKDQGLVIIGIHTPEFEFEKDAANIKKAIKELGITWPVVMDNNFTNWNAFANKYWPSKYLIDKKGYIAYNHHGEGAYQETENEIQRLLKQDSTVIMLPKIESDDHLHGKVCFIPTPETYCGHDRGKLANQEYRENKVAEYKRPSEIPLHGIALNGKFNAQKEYVESAKEKAELILHFIATEVNLVLAPVGTKSVVDVRFNGEIMPLEIKGHDVSEAGEVIVDSSRMYTLIRAREQVEGILTVRAQEGNFRAYAFTFSGCEE